MSEDKPRRRLRPLLLIIGGIAAAVLILPTCLAQRENKPPDAPEDELPIRLLWVRPDDGNAVFDAAGKLIGEETRCWAESDGWQPNHLHRDFLLEIPGDMGDVLLAGAHVRYGGGLTAQRSTTAAFHQFQSADGPRAIVFASLPASEYRIWPLSLSGGNRPSRIDLTVEFFHGPRGKAALTFTGPFEPATVFGEDSGAPAEITSMRRYDGYRTIARFHLAASGEAGGGQVIAYDTDGRRHLAAVRAAMGSSSGYETTFEIEGLRIEDIAAITVGEQPRERTFRDVRIAYRGLPDRTHPEFLDKMRAVLKDFPKDGSGTPYEFASPTDALAVIDIVRGRYAVAASAALRAKDFDRKSLDAASLEKIRKAALEWARSWDVEVAEAGLRLGLSYGWHECYPMAVAMLADDDGRRRAMASDVVTKYRDLVSDDDIPALLGEVARAHDSNVLFCLMTALNTDRTPALAAALPALASDERPWVWYEAIRRLEGRTDALGEPPTWDRELKKRVAVVLGLPYSQGDPELPDEVRAMLPALLTPAMDRLLHNGCRNLLDRIVEKCDKADATAAIAGFLEACEEPGAHAGTILLAIRQLNRMHGTDIGGVGAVPNAPLTHWGCCDWQQIAEDAVTWCRTGVDPGQAVHTHRVSDRDLRVAWVNKNDKELSLVGLWPCTDGPGAPPRLYALARGEDCLAYRVGPVLRASDVPRWNIQFQVGMKDSVTWPSMRIDPADLPLKLEFDAAFASNHPQCQWEIYVERAGAPESVLSGTKVFDDWWARYGPPAPPEQE